MRSGFRQLRIFAVFFVLCSLLAGLVVAVSSWQLAASYGQTASAPPGTSSGAVQNLVESTVAAGAPASSVGSTQTLSDAELQIAAAQTYATQASTELGR